MIQYLSLQQVVELHHRVISQSGGSHGIRDMAVLETAIAQPAMEFGGQALYPSLAEKASALAYSLVQNHPFIDGDKRTGHAAMEVFLVLNGYEIRASIDAQEQLFLRLASGQVTREELARWIEKYSIPYRGNK